MNPETQPAANPKINPENLWQWQGRFNRTAYFLIGAIALPFKILVDYYVATQIFHRDWNPFFYWRSFHNIYPQGVLSPIDAGFAIVMLLLSLPFIWLGLTTIVKRLRDAGEPLWLAALFFVPIGNFLFFLVLAVLPSKNPQPGSEAAPWPNTRPLDLLIPRRILSGGILSIAIAVFLGLLFTLVSVTGKGVYSLSLFVGVPFIMGLLAVLFYSYHEPRTYSSCIIVSLTPVLILGAVLLFVAAEGIICIAMAAPIAAALAFLGGSLGYSIQITYWTRRGAPFVISAILFVIPAWQHFERVNPPQPQTYEVHSSIIVDAPPELVWKKVVSFSQIPEPKELLFRSGIAYPIRAEITGTGPGAIRRCVFSTGPFVEPIEVWDEPRLLRFGVTENPAPLNELSPYGHIEPAHLHGYFVSHQGQFQLEALPNHQTRITGTTWYTNALWPEQYWHHWSDYIIHRIHMRVLDHIRNESEHNTTAVDKSEISHKEGTIKKGINRSPHYRTGAVIDFCASTRS
jgi:uncharacterized membrane protein YhaH (DUF805 family)